jgi:polar amino acid transport system substrate-binding protein
MACITGKRRRKMMRFRIIILSICTAALLLCGCTAQGNGASGKDSGLPELKIGIDASYEPYTYIDENGDYAGVDVELAEEACSRMGMQPVFNGIKWDNKKDYLEDGTIDCVWSCFSMQGREDEYDWAGPYMYSRQVVAVRSDSDINKLSDLTGSRVAVMSSTKPEAAFLEHDSENIPIVDDVYCMESMDLAFSALKAGYVDATAGHESVMLQYIQTEPDKYRILDDALMSSEVGVAFGKGKNRELREKLAQTLNEMKEDGTLQGILEQYGMKTGEESEMQ